ncbi:hypothetical protein [Streptomyces sp. H27-H5]
MSRRPGVPTGGERHFKPQRFHADNAYDRRLGGSRWVIERTMT